MNEPCINDRCAGKLRVIRSKFYPDERVTRRVKKCTTCGRKIVTRETVTNGNASSTYLPAPKMKFERFDTVLTQSRK